MVSFPIEALDRPRSAECHCFPRSPSANVALAGPVDAERSGAWRARVKGDGSAGKAGEAVLVTGGGKGRPTFGPVSLFSSQNSSRSSPSIRNAFFICPLGLP